MGFFSKTKLIIFSIIITLLFSNLAYADEIESKTIQQDGILKTINEEQLVLDELSNQYTAAIIKQQALKDNLKDTRKEIRKLKKEIKKEQTQLEKQTVIAYKDGKIPALDIILNSSSFEAFTTNVDFCCRYMNQTNTIVQKKKSLERAKKEQEAIQQQQLEKLEQAIQEMEEAKIKAKATIQDLQSQYEQLDEEIAVLVLQQQLTSNQPVQIEEFNNYITNNATDVLSSGNAAAEIWQGEIETEEPAGIVKEEVEESVENTEIEEPIKNTEIKEQDSIEIEKVENEEPVKSEESIDPTSNDVVERAYSMIGSPYFWGGTTSDGFDCSGFVSYCLSGEEGTRLGTTETFSGWTQVTDPQPGDVCVVHNDSSQHTGIYVGDGNMVHAATYGVGVIEGPVQDGMIYVRYE